LAEEPQFSQAILSSFHGAGSANAGSASAGSANDNNAGIRFSVPDAGYRTV
jgi:hypothetical protein